MSAVFALSLICLIIFFVVEAHPTKSISMLDLTEFKDLPAELRVMIRASLPKPSLIKKQWATMTPQQKQMVQHQLSSQIPKPGPPPPPAPSQVIKPPAPVKAPAPVPSGMKSGFLLPNGVNKSKKKNTKDKKEDEIVTLSDIGASEDDVPLDVGDDGSDA